MFLSQKFNQNLKTTILDFFQRHDQDKIKFAIDELNKLLEKVKPLDVMVRTGHYINQRKVNVVFEEDIKRKIEELKGETNDTI